MEALAGVPDACMDVVTAVVVTETVDAGADRAAQSSSNYSRMSRGHDGRRDCKGVTETLSDNARALLNKQQTNKLAKK